MTRICEHIDAEATDELRSIAREIRYKTDKASTTVDVVATPAAGIVPDKKSISVLTSVPLNTLRPWREIIEPHPDVARGEYRNAEFAAGLNQVAKGGGTTEYRDPVEFFARTYLTEASKRLLKASDPGETPLRSASLT